MFFCTYTRERTIYLQICFLRAQGEESDQRKEIAVPIGTILLLGAFAGLTIYLGLPLAFLKHTPRSLKIFLNMLATGVLIFLFYDVIGKASEPIGTALGEVRTQPGALFTFSLDTALLVLGIGLGSVGLVYFNRYVFGRIRIGTTAPAVAASDTATFSQVPSDSL